MEVVVCVALGVVIALAVALYRANRNEVNEVDEDR
jgi:hypothetical protein